MAYRDLKVTESSFIAKVEYDYDFSKMRVSFNNGTVVEGTGVPASVADEFTKPKASAGSLWHSQLKGKYPGFESGK